MQLAGLTDADLFAGATAVFVGEVTDRSVDEIAGRSDPKTGEPTRSSTDSVTLTFTARR